MSASSSTLARWYAQMASFCEAGFTVERAVENSRGLGRGEREALLARLRDGDSFETAMARAAPWVPELDRQLIAAGAVSGRLPEMLRRLVTKHEEGIRASRRAVLATLYPLAVAHFAALAFPIKTAVVDGDLAAYGVEVFKILIPAWVCAAAFVAAVRMRFRPALAFLDIVPLVRGYRRTRALADLCFALEAQIVAGIRLDVAWLQAAIAAGDRRLEALAMRVAETVQDGQPVSVAIEDRPELPSPFAAFWSNGEQTGRIEESLQHLQKHFSDIASRRLMLASVTYPIVLFVVVALWVAVRIIGFYVSYFQGLSSF